MSFRVNLDRRALVFASTLILSLMGAPAAARQNQALDALREAYPGVRVHVEGRRIAAIYGVPMTPGGSPAEAAATFLSAHSEAFGIGIPTLTRTWQAKPREGHLNTFAYTQTIEGYRVVGALLRIGVLDSDPPRVSFA
ncbi:MAG: hypothetical protein ACKVW3_07580 [Phycisphaerales bacterium]